MGRGSRGQFTTGSDGSWVTRCDHCQTSAGVTRCTSGLKKWS